jgi:hypothetical protein
VGGGWVVGGWVVGGWVGSYPLLSQAPTHVEVELGCDNDGLSIVHVLSL